MDISFEELKSTRLSLDLSKVQKHEVKVGDLELVIMKDDSWIATSIVLKVEGYGEVDLASFRPTIKSYGGEPEYDNGLIERKYNEMLDILQKGKYKLHLYSNGKIEVEFT